MYLNFYALIRSIENQLLKSTAKALSEYERGNGVKKMKFFLFRKWNLVFKTPAY